MRLVCDTEIINRSLASLSIKKRSKPIRSTVSLGKHVSSGVENKRTVFLLVCTSKDRIGTKYKILNNIEGVFTKFVAEGKITLSLKEPMHNICISKADLIHLKSFLSTLKLIISSDGNLDNIKLSSLAPASKSQVEKLKTKLFITTQKEYFSTKTLPSSLEVLQISCGLKRFDSRILQLPRLKSIDVSENKMTELPKKFGRVTTLSELKLSQNRLTTFPDIHSLRHTLMCLDLSSNSIVFFPEALFHLRNLVNLNLDNNSLIEIPTRINKLVTLRFLRLAGNQLSLLPSGITMLHLESFDIFNNPFQSVGPESHDIDKISTSVPMMLEFAARSVINNMVDFTLEPLPLNLLQLLKDPMTCSCNKSCFESYIKSVNYFDLRKISSTVIGDRLVPVLSYFCSYSCYKKSSKNR